jgi:D,D-heptose 1,7-bisphosphate phosphatase
MNPATVAPPTQCAILVGGLGTRLGELTVDTPKPLLDCGGRPFLAWIVRELSRYGVSDVVLLAGYRSERVEKFCAEVQKWLPKQVAVSVSVEPKPAGTGGAIWYARDLLQDQFLVINGDSWFDTNLARLFAAAEREKTTANLLLRRISDSSRYGTVELQGKRVTGFREKDPLGGAGIINAGVYLFSREILDHINESCSLERDVLPALAARGGLAGEVLDGYFIDIGIPSDYARAGEQLPRMLRRPAVFFDRDGVINEDIGWVGSVDRFHWIEGAKDALQLLADSGYHAFLVTNQAGVARGLYSEEDVVALHRHISQEVLAIGGTIDDIRYCPDHPDATVEQYRRPSEHRKPQPGMILDLLSKWEIPKGRSLLVGDKESDIQAATAAGIAGYRYQGGNLCDFIKRLLPTNSADEKVTF